MRSVGVACFNFRNDHNGWFPPGDPLKASPTSSVNFNAYLVPEYLPELPICPAAKRKMPLSQIQYFKTEKKWFQSQGGTYMINSILTQWKPEALPGPIGWWRTFQASNTPLLCEIYFGGGQSRTWALVHQDMTIDGDMEQGWGVPARSHGRTKDALNFMFLDGHIELVSRNDQRKVPDSQKSWLYPSNPNGRFAAESAGRLFVQTTQLSTNEFIKIYGSQN